MSGDDVASPASAEEADNVPDATLWPPSPTRRDRIRYTSLYLAVLVSGALALSVAFEAASGWLSPRGSFLLLYRGPTLVGAIAGAVLISAVLAQLAFQVALARRFPVRQDRLVFERLLRYRKRRSDESIEMLHWSRRAEAERYAANSSRLAESFATLVMVAMVLAGIFVWAAYAGMYAGVDASGVQWRSWTLTTHRQPPQAIGAVWSTFTTSGRHHSVHRPCVVVQFRDGTAMNTSELHLSDAERDGLASMLSELSGVPVKSVPALSLVPPPH